MTGYEIIGQLLGVKPGAAPAEMMAGCDGLTTGGERLEAIRAALGIPGELSAGQLQALIVMLASEDGHERTDLLAQHTYRVAMREIEQREPRLGHVGWQRAVMAQKPNAQGIYLECTDAVDDPHWQAIAARLAKTPEQVRAESERAGKTQRALSEYCDELAALVDAGESAAILPVQIRQLERLADAAGVSVTAARARAKLTANHWAVVALVGRD